jgi:hypothetical protein
MVAPSPRNRALPHRWMAPTIPRPEGGRQGQFAGVPDLDCVLEHRSGRVAKVERQQQYLQEDRLRRRGEGRSFAG